MDKIVLKDLEATACHGVNPEEKVTPQRFLISAEIFLDFGDAAHDDDLNKTVSYSAVKKQIIRFVEGNPFDLIETVAASLAKLILCENPLANGVKITVKKPDAPMSGNFDFVAVHTELKWSKIYLSLGSNMGDRNAYLDLAVSELKKDPAFRNVRESDRIATPPYGGVAHGEFLNSAVEADTWLDPYELLNAVNAIEAAAGRKRDVRWGDRTLDIDILFYDDIVLGDDRLCIPHIDMANREFVLKPLAQLAPYKAHPLVGKRVAEMLKDLQQKNEK